MRSRIFIALFLILAIAIGVAGCQQENRPTEVAIVNGEPISFDEYEEAVEMNRKRFEEQYGEGILEQEMAPGVTMLDYLKESILESMIFERIVFQEAVKNDFLITEEELEELMIIQKSGFEDEADYLSYIESMGMTDDYIRDFIRRDETIHRYLEDFMDDLNISEEEVETHFRSNEDQFVYIRARHILVYSLEEAEQIRSRLEAGEDFSKLASIYSEDHQSAIDGGNLDLFSKGDRVPEFEEVAFNLEVGVISQVVTTDHGFHIIKVDERIDSYESVKEQVLSDLKNQKYREKMDQLESESSIERKIEF